MYTYAHGHTHTEAYRYCCEEHARIKEIAVITPNQDAVEQ